MTSGKCNYIREDGSRCKRPAGYLTDHPGVGLCYIHERGDDTKTSLKNRITRYMGDNRPLDLRREIALLRAMLGRFVELHEDDIGDDSVVNDEIRRTTSAISQAADKMASILGRYNITPDDILYLEKVFIGIIMELTKHDPSQRRLALKLLREAFPGFKRHGAELIAGASISEVVASASLATQNPDDNITDI